MSWHTWLGRWVSMDQMSLWVFLTGSSVKDLLFLNQISPWTFNLIYFLKILFIFREKGREGEGKGEKHQCAVISGMPRTGDLACNPGMCPDWETNRPPFGSQASTQSPEPHQPGLHGHLNKTKWTAREITSHCCCFAFLRSLLLKN